MGKIKRALGRGLGAILEDVESSYNKELEGGNAENLIPAIREPNDGNGANSALYKDDVPSGHDRLTAGCAVDRKSVV